MKNLIASTGMSLILFSALITYLKKKEFQDLQQGSMNVSEYLTRFTELSCYAPNNVDNDEKRQDCFLNGLNDGLAYALEACDFENF
jgi:hypothetical protein